LYLSNSALLGCIEIAPELQPTGVADNGLFIGTRVSNTRDTISADFDEDGSLDLFMGAYQYLSAVHLGNGDGTFEDPNQTFNNLYSDDVATGDFNEDGHIDIVSVGRNTNKLLLGNGDGTFNNALEFNAFGNKLSYHSAVADINNDGHLDVIVGNDASSSGNVNGLNEIYLGNGDGTFTSSIALNDFGPKRHRAITLADVNGDGNLDALLANGADQNF
jgi:hypothetical protein